MRPTRVLLALLLAAGSLLPVEATAKDKDKDKWCSRRHARHVVFRFIDAYNEGKFRTLDRLFAEEPDFAFYRLAPEREWPSSEDRSELIAYFRERHELEDVLEITDFHMNKERGSGPPNIWGFGYEIERTSSDLMPWGDGTISGKGAVDCTIIAWNASWSP